MKSDKDIIDDFGKKVVDSLFDPSIGNLISLRAKENPPVIFKDYVDLFKKLDESDFNILKRYLKESMGNAMFNFLKVFEEHPQFKIIYDENGKQVDLNKISEMLKAEPIIENGWIKRFSQELKNESPS
jgi:hypothetical protein